LKRPSLSARSASGQAPVAQLDRVLPSEGRGHWFESSRVRQYFASKNNFCSYGSRHWRSLRFSPIEHSCLFLFTSSESSNSVAPSLRRVTISLGFHMPAADMTHPATGSIAGPWAFGIILLVTAALTAFGFSADKMRLARDANIEIGLLLRGPLSDFQNKCRAFVEQSAPNFQSRQKGEFVKRAKEANLKVAEELIVSPTFVCPFPEKAQTVRKAVNLILEYQAANAIYVSPNLINDLANEIKHSAQTDNETATVLAGTLQPGIFRGIQDIASKIIVNPDTSFREFGVYAYQFESERELTIFGNCPQHHHLFKPLTSETPRDLRIVMKFGRYNNYCLELAKGDEKYLQPVIFGKKNFLRWYFASRILLEPSYSRPEAADTRPRNWTMGHKSK
jgi:hypothetical protein